MTCTVIDIDAISTHLTASHVTIAQLEDEQTTEFIKDSMKFVNDGLPIDVLIVIVIR